MTTAAHRDPAHKTPPLLRPGRNCWRIAHAPRLALIVDGEAYFRAVKEAILLATHSVYLIGWDFDTRILFEPGDATLEGPNQLGAFLRWFGKHRPHVDVYVLKWDLSLLQALGRGSTPLMILKWLTSRNIHLRLDGAHPKGASHHQKIVVVDDVVAFCGGIDMTGDRWDTREHRDEDPRRQRPDGRRHGPWHDASTVLDGDAAKALGELARVRWKWASGKELDPPGACAPIWPDSISAGFRDIPVAIARTIPKYKGREEVREIERLYLDAIAEAQRAIYCESQYFASRRIAEAMADRLREKDGPEIVVINPESADGFLAAAAMDSARYRLLKLVRDADSRGRFRIYTPITEQGQPIYVHAKILVIDDRLLRVGSSNFNNRSLGFDSECDLAIEALPGMAGGRATQEEIRAVRNGLLAEHLGTSIPQIERSIESHGSLIAAMETLRRQGRSLVPYEPDEPAAVEELLAKSDLLDPEEPAPWTERALQLVSRGSLR